MGQGASGIARDDSDAKVQGEPIAAIATAAGKGAIGVVRISGEAQAVRAMAQAVTGLAADALKARHAHYGPFLDEAGSAIDAGLAIFFPAPHSYTGESVLELQGHGGPVVMQLLLRRVLQAGTPFGARLAEPGEFTQRAYLNGKMDLAQSEAVMDLIDASSAHAARSATRSLQGEFSRRIDALSDQIVELRALVESTLDFPEEEIEFLEQADAAGRLSAMRSTLQEVLASARQGALLRSGLDVVLAGRPNAGKSSLLNALAGTEVAIVTPIAGTTRDRVVQGITLDGLPVNVIDTAGLRDEDDPDVDPIERIGIQRTWAEIGKADVVVHVIDADAMRSDRSDVGPSFRNGQADADARCAQFAGAGNDETRCAAEAVARDDEAALLAEIVRRAPASAVRIEVHNKIDLLPGDSGRDAGPDLGRDAGQGANAGEARAACVDAPLDPTPDAPVQLSARTGEGIDSLRRRLQAIAGYQPGGEDVFLARERHLHALESARSHLSQADALLAHGDAGLELLAEELRLAHAALQSITGTMSADDLLGVVFARFCIGK